MSTLTARRLSTTLAILTAVLLVCMLLGLAFGSSAIDWLQLFSGRGDSEQADSQLTILLEVRLPRVILAAFVGATLATVGAVFQAILRNPLAEPYVLGTSGGASVGVVLSQTLGLTATAAGISVLFFAAFTGALGSVAIIYGLAALLPEGGRGRQASFTLLLTGVVFNAFAMAFVLLMQTLMSPLDSQRVLFWLMGSLTSRARFDAEFWTAIVCMTTGLLALVSSSRRLNLLALGDEAALALGVEAGRTRFLLFLASSLAVGGAVAISGMIGFVGLVVPHSIRLALGADNRLLLPASMIGGAAFLVLADLLARLAFPLAQSALPVGVITAFVGVPLFFYFLVRNLRQSFGTQGF